MKRFIFWGLLAALPFMANAQEGMVRYFSKDAAPTIGPAPDYSNLYYWAASPFKHDCADSLPAFLDSESRDSSVDVFFIHPTTYIGSDEDKINVTDLDLSDLFKLAGSMRKAAWNANLDDTFLNDQTDIKPILYQASVFNGSCRIFAPRYRQANLKAFLVRKSSKAQETFDLAYGDIKAAFQYYLDHYNHGRPIIIAGHSQGSLHAIRLLQDFFDGTPLQKQLVCAYVIGYQIEKDAFKYIPVGTSPRATGCVVGWRSFQKGEIPPEVKSEDGNSICINPLTWTDASTWAPDSLDLGSMMGFDNFSLVGKGTMSTYIEPSTKVLWVTLPDGVNPKVKKWKNLHIYDYNLFWMNIRENVRERIEAWHQTHS